MSQLQLQLQAYAPVTPSIVNHLYTTMKSSILLPLCTAVLAAAVHPPQVVLGDSQTPIAEPEKFLIELEPGKTQWVTEDDKWALRRVSSHLFREALIRLQLPT